MAVCHCTGACNQSRCPNISPPQPQTGTWKFTPTLKPLTEDAVRRIIREELDR